MASKQPFINDSGTRQNISFPASSIEMSDGTTAQAAVESLRQSDTSLNTFKASIESKYRKANTAYAKDSMSYAAELPAGFYLECTTAGTTSTGALVLPSTVADGTTFSDGTVSWTIRKTGGGNATLTRDGVIDALGYTPSNSGLTKTELTQMIQNGELGDVSVVQLPYKQIVTGTNIPPASNYEGVFTWANKTDSSGKMRMQLNDVSYETHDWSSQYGKDGIVFSGLTIGSSVDRVGAAIGIIEGGLVVKFKGTNGSYEMTSKTSKDSSTPWVSLCDRYGILGQAKSVAFLNYYDIGDIANWKNFNIKPFPYGLSTCMMKITANGVEGYYFTLVMKYGSDNPHAKLGYSGYATEYTDAGMMIMFPFANVPTMNNMFWFSFGYNEDQSDIIPWNWSSVAPDVTGDRNQ